MLHIRKLPKWKEKQEQLRKSSFDDALEILGVRQKFVAPKKEKKKEKECAC